MSVHKISTILIICLAACSCIVARKGSKPIGKWHLAAIWTVDSLFKEKDRKFTYDKASFLLMKNDSTILVRNNADIFLPSYTGERYSHLEGKWWIKGDSLFFSFDKPRIIKEKLRFRIINGDTLETAVKFDNEELYRISKFVKEY